MTLLLAVLVWTACARLAYLLHKSWWRNLVDYSRSDRAGALVFVILGGPFALLIALILWLSETWSLRNGDEVLEPRKSHDSR